jgi:hypothetical protein
MIASTKNAVLGDGGMSAWTSRNDIAAVNIETSATTYTSRQPILLRIGIKNVSPQTYAFLYGAPWRRAVLVVKDAAGRDVAPMSSRDVTDYESAQGHAAYPTQPGQTLWLAWDLSEWSDISHWGFELKPGTYTIFAIPMVAGQLPVSTMSPKLSALPAQGKFATDQKTVNSNSVTIQVSP